MKDFYDQQTYDMFYTEQDPMVMPETYDADLLNALMQLGSGDLAYAILEYRRLTALENT